MHEILLKGTSWKAMKPCLQSNTTSKDLPIEGWCRWSPSQWAAPRRGSPPAAQPRRTCAGEHFIPHDRCKCGILVWVEYFWINYTPSIKNLHFTPEHTTFIQDVPMKWVLLYTSCNQLPKCRGINMVPDPFWWTRPLQAVWLHRPDPVVAAWS